MSALTIEEATLEDAYDVAEQLRREDAQEIRTVTGADPIAVVPEAVRISRMAFTLRRQSTGEAVGVFGVADDPRSPTFGNAWLLATPNISRVSLALLEVSPALLKRLGEPYADGLHCAVDTRNHMHCRWLKRVGFAARDVCRINGVPFVHYVRYHQNNRLRS